MDQNTPPPANQAAFAIPRWEFIAIAAGLMALNALATDIMLPALQEMGAALGVENENHRQYVIPAYMLGFGFAQLFFGPLSDRFGLWLGFHNADQDTFFAMIEAYAERYKLGVPAEELRKQAVEWSATRGSRSGRVAWQFIQDLAGELGQRLD